MPKRYRDGDPRNTWHYTTRAMDILESVGLIEQAQGSGVQTAVDTSRWRGPLVPWWPWLDRCSTFRASPSDPAGGDDRPAQPARQGGHRLPGDRRHHRHARAGGSGERGPVPSRSRQLGSGWRFRSAPNLQWLLRTWRSFLLPRRLLPEHARPPPSRPRMHDRRRTAPHGRDRLPTLHITMAYTDAGATLPRGDLYEIEGFDRRLVKIAVNIMFNAESRRSAVLAIAKALHDDATLVQRAVTPLTRRGGITKHSRPRRGGHRAQHRRIEDHFNSDCGAQFQRLDSDIAIEVMTQIIHQTVAAPYPIHDSFWSQTSIEEKLRRTMREVAKKRGLSLKVKNPRQLSPPSRTSSTPAHHWYPHHRFPGPPSNRFHHSARRLSPELYPETPA